MAVTYNKLEQNLKILFSNQNKRYVQYRTAEHRIANQAARINKLVTRIFDPVTTLPTHKENLSHSARLHHFNKERAKFIATDLQTHLANLTTISFYDLTEEAVVVFASEWCNKLAQLNCQLFCNEQGRLKAQFNGCISGIVQDFAYYNGAALNAKIDTSTEFESKLIGAYNEFIFQGITTEFGSNITHPNVKRFLAHIQTQHAQTTAQCLQDLALNYKQHQADKVTKVNSIAVPPSNWKNKLSLWAGRSLGFTTALVTLPLSLPIGLYLNFKQPKLQNPFVQGLFDGFTSIATPIAALSQRLASLFYVPVSKTSPLAIRSKTKTSSSVIYLNVLQVHNGDLPHLKDEPSSPVHAGCYEKLYQTIEPNLAGLRQKSSEPRVYPSTPELGLR